MSTYSFEVKQKADGHKCTKTAKTLGPFHLPLLKHSKKKTVLYRRRRTGWCQEVGWLVGRVPHKAGEGEEEKERWSKWKERAGRRLIRGAQAVKSE